MIDLEHGLEVLRVIGRHSREHPVDGATLEEITGVNTRTVAEIVSVAVQKGVPVGSCSRGYFQWQSKLERDEYFARERARLISVARKVSAAKKAANNPLTLFEQAA